MKTTILTILFSVLLNGFTFAQDSGSEFEPYWHCVANDNIGPPIQRGETGFTCWAQCVPVLSAEDPIPEDQLFNGCSAQVRTDNFAEDARRCEQSLGPVTPCFPASSGGGTSNADKALIAGGVAIAAVAAYHFLAPEMPEGLNVRPVANLAYRDGLAVSVAGLKGNWRNLEFSAMSANAGEGWTKPYARVQWAWAF